MPFISNETVSLNDLHIAAGGTSETTCSLNDTDIKAIRSDTSGSAVTFDQFGVSPVYTFTVTAAAGGTNNATKGYTADSPGIGSISPDPPVLEDIYSAWKIQTLAKFDGFTAEPIYFKMSKFNVGDSAANSGWEHLVIGDTSFYRGSADTYSTANNDNEMVWQWFTDPTNASAILGANPFNMSGTTTVKIA